MNSFFTGLLSDKKDGEIFRCFGVWHLGYILLFMILAAISYRYLKKKGAGTIEKYITGWARIAFGLYIADFFLMPLAYGQIDVEKLPFHICTAMCVLCFLSRHNRFFRKFRLQFAALGFVSNLVYLLYPAGVMWHGVHPLSYRVVQTLFFHGIMMVYGFLVLCFEKDGFAWRKCYRDIILIVSMTVWAIVGNALYNSQTRVYNWFFVVQDPFSLFPREAAPFIMPVLNVVLFFAAVMLVYLLLVGLPGRCGRKGK